ncbi:MAG: queuosine precursor transporter [Muribaculaceae bacterium]|nr:queuosine precursor transporter [Muribaculaceae bacterium]MDE5968251.1 queuosine precursor transporter [Muribaculaceae bacterium]
MSTIHNNGYSSHLPTQPSTRLSVLFLCLTVLFCVCLIVANLIEIKTIAIGEAVITAGFIVFPISYIINDCVVEVYGLRRARIMIWLGFASSLFVALMLQLAIMLPGSADWQHQESMRHIYGTVPRIMAASYIAFLCGSMVNAYVMNLLKQRHGADRRFSFRAIISTLLGEGLDSILFFPIAFAGTLPLSTIISLILTQTLLKTLYEIAVLPVTIRVVRRLKRAEEQHPID